MNIKWQNLNNLDSKKYRCGYCGSFISSEKGYYAQIQETARTFGFIYVCHSCHQPTFFDAGDRQTPGSLYGEDVLGIDDSSVESLYKEARSCYSTNSFTAVVLCCRKLLMHIAVAKGAKENLSFMEYVEHLSNQNFIPPGAKEWVDQIREKGNEANHEIVIMTEENARDILSFMQMLLKIVYEFPASVKKKS